MPFGQNVLYYDGVSIHCMSDTGSVRWSFQIGADAGYDCNDSVVVAWAGSTIYILDQNGNSSYNDNLGEEIQFARVGTQYVAAVIGETTSPRLVVKDHTGAHMDEEADAFDTLILLDVGFYGKNGEYMWTLALDVFGTAANTILNTFEVGKMNTGEVSLGEPIAYAVVYENSLLRVINTRKMLTFNDRGTGGYLGQRAGVRLAASGRRGARARQRADALCTHLPDGQHFRHPRAAPDLRQHGQALQPARYLHRRGGVEQNGLCPQRHHALPRRYQRQPLYHL